MQPPPQEGDPHPSAEQIEAILADLRQQLERHSRHYAGYPENLRFDYGPLHDFLRHHLNNAGDPFLDGGYGLHTKTFEQACLAWFAQLYELPNYWGYVTGGGTEGNLYGLLLGRTRHPEAVLYASEASHYSIDKAACLLRIPHRRIRASPDGVIDTDHLQRELEASGQGSAIVSLNLGTTMTGAVDDIDRVVAVLERSGQRFHLHCDGALGGMLLPFLAGAPPISFRRHPIGSIAVSGHKFIGAPIPFGLVLTHADHAERCSQLIPYLGNRDMTISGSRSGLAPLLLWYALKTRGPSFAAEAARCVQEARHLHDALRRSGWNPLLHPFSTTVVFDRPPLAVCQKWQLATEGSRAHVVVLQHLDRERIDAFLEDLAMTRRHDGSLSRRFRAATERFADRIALIEGDRELSFAAVDAAANRIAQALRHRGVGVGTPVGVRLERSARAVIAVLGVLKAGGVYVPVDPGFPQPRQDLILSDSGCPVLISEGGRGVLPPSFRGTVLDPEVDDLSAFPDEDPDLDLPADATLAILYTSGSTGIPKGVCCTQQATLNRFAWMWQQYPFAEGEVCCHRTTLNFVDSVWEIFGALLQGVPLVILPPSARADPAAMVALLRERRVSRLVLVPSLLRALLLACPDLGERLPALTLWTVSGERLSAGLLKAFRAAVPRGTLLNLYGSTEVAGDVTWAEFAPGAGTPETVPIGRPITNADLYILDEQGQLVRPGAVGELWVGGAVLASGYHNRPEETRQRFLTNPFTGQGMIFRTGDLVSRDERGVLHYVGRRDHQVKIRGVRVELEEVEAALAGFSPEIRELAVIPTAHPALPETTELTAFVSPAGIDPVALRAYALDHLGAAMVPARVIALDDWPLNPHGKTDRAALARRLRRPGPEAAGEPEPLGAAEAQIAELWREILRVDPIRREDDFFALGGDSLSCIVMLARLRQSQGVELPLAEVVAAPTLRRMAELLASARRDPAGLPALPAGIELRPLTAKHGEGTAALVSRTFCARGPLERCLGIRAEELQPYVADLTRQCLEAGLSAVALERSTARPVGFCLAKDFAAPPPAGLEVPAGFRPIAALLEDLDRRYAEGRGGIGTGEVMDVLLTGVEQGSDGTAIVLALEHHMPGVARRGGFSRVVTTCTHAVTLQIALELGYRPLHALAYDRFAFEGRRVFAGLPAPHREAVLLELVL